MKKKTLVYTLFIFSAFCVFACRLSIPSYPTGKILFQDDFSSNETDWDTWYQESVSAVSILDGEMIMIVEKPNIDVISTNQVAYPNIEMEVKAKKKFGSDNNVFGFVCRYLDDENYYSFLMSSDGYFGIAKMYQGIYTLLSSEVMQYSELINKGDQENYLMATCSGSKFSFSVNGSMVASVTDSDLNAGKNGLLVGSFEDEGEIVITFDDFMVKVD